MFRIFSKEEQMKALVVLETYKKSRPRKKITLRERIVGVVGFFVEFAGFKSYFRRPRRTGRISWAELKDFLFPFAHLSRKRQEAPWFIKKSTGHEGLRGFILNSLRAFGIWDSSFYPSHLKKKAGWKAKAVAALIGLAVVGWMFLFLLPQDIEIKKQLSIQKEQEIQVVLVEPETMDNFRIAMERALTPKKETLNETPEPKLMEIPAVHVDKETARLQQELIAAQEALQEARAQYASELSQKDAEAQTRVRAAVQTQRKAAQKLVALQKQSQKLVAQEEEVAQKEAEIDAKVAEAESKFVAAQKKADELEEKLQQAQKTTSETKTKVLSYHDQETLDFYLTTLPFFFMFEVKQNEVMQSIKKSKNPAECQEMLFLFALYEGGIEKLTILSLLQRHKVLVPRYFLEKIVDTYLIIRTPVIEVVKMIKNHPESIFFQGAILDYLCLYEGNYPIELPLVIQKDLEEWQE